MRPAYEVEITYDEDGIKEYIKHFKVTALMKQVPRDRTYFVFTQAQHAIEHGNDSDKKPFSKELDLDITKSAMFCDR